MHILWGKIMTIGRPEQMFVIKNADVYAPEYLGLKDILTEGEKIVRIADHIDEYDSIAEVEKIDLKGRRLVPGYIDLHEHITGGGGEKGPCTRVPEARLSELIAAGVTTVVGLLGTDGVTRSPENLLAKTREFNEEGITAFMLCGSYGVPPVTLTGSVERDLILIGECIGVKTAMSDHRSSNLTSAGLTELASMARRGGMLAGCAGYTTIHMGSGKAGLQPLFECLENSDIPVEKFLPTHITRTPELFDQGLRFTDMGGMIDATAGSDEESLKETAEMIAAYFAHDESASHMTLTSDGFGSMPVFDEHMVFAGMTWGSPKSLHRQLRVLTEQMNIPLSKALRLLTVNPAHVLCMDGRKGAVRAGCDADMIVYDGDMNIDTVFARGRKAMENGRVLMKGMFE